MRFFGTARRVRDIKAADSFVTEAFAACLPGLEPILLRELNCVGAVSPVSVPGGANFQANTELLMRCGLWLGTASHISIRVAKFHCRTFEHLERASMELPWVSLLRRDMPLKVVATSKKSKLIHTGAISERVNRSITKRIGITPQLVVSSSKKCAQDQEVWDHQPKSSVNVRFEGDTCTISINCSSDPLWRRGYRLDTAKAPLREDIAHALLLQAGVRGPFHRLGNDDPFKESSITTILDPMAGSGTIPIEAAGIMLGLAPGRLRPPPLSHLALFDEKIWNSVSKPTDAERSQPRTAEIAISASDRDAGAAKSMRANAARAGVDDFIQFHCTSIKAHPSFSPGNSPPRGLLVTNPPYGKRIHGRKKSDNGQSKEDRRRSVDPHLPLYQTIGNCAKALGSGWGVSVIVNDPILALKSGIEFKPGFSTRHGGLSVAAMHKFPESTVK